MSDVIVSSPIDAFMLSANQAAMRTALGVIGIADGGTAATTASAALDSLITAEVDVASATTTNLGAVTSRNVRITGTTTITGFGTANAGIMRFGRFAGILTLTHNATSLILPGGANITTAANDRFIAFSLGSGKWFVYLYQTAAASGGAVWGAITGTLFSQTDLLNALNAKQKYANDAFIVVQTTDDPVANGLALIAAYQAAIALNPNGLPIGETNHAVVIVPPGRYEFIFNEDEEEWQTLGLSENYVDLIGLTGIASDVILTSACDASNSGTLIVICNFCDIKGITCENTGETRVANNQTDASALCTDISQSGITYTNCVFKDGGGTSWCMRQGITIDSTFISCSSGDYSLGAHGGEFSGVARNTTVGSNSLGGDAVFSGSAFDCVAGGNSYGGGATGVLSGLAVRCRSSGNYCFGGDYIQGGGTLTDCVAVNNSFGNSSIGSGCRLVNCFAGNDSFAGAGHIYDGSTFIGCTAGTTSFGDEAESSTVFSNCAAGTNSFGTSLFSAKCVNCLAVGSGSFGGQGTFDGELVDCQLVALNTPWAPPTSMAGNISRVTFWQFGTDENAVTVCDGATTEFSFCTFKANGTGTPIGIVALGAATLKVSYCKLNTVTGFGVGITNALGATLVDAFNIGNTSV